MKKKEKEEDRVERIIRSLLKLPENRRCINCNSLGPQYVCTTFLTFVCTNCSGVHREFTHRVKSVSMAKFKAEEVSALQAGGNERARQIYFKDWDPQRNSYPDGSNLHKLRDFIKHVYVDRKYSGERSTERLPRLRLSEKGESYESKKIGLYSFQLKSPSYKDRYENSERCRPGGRSDDICLKYSYDERSSPRYGLDNSRYGGLKKKPVQFEIVDDRFRDERTTGKQSDNRRFSHREARYGSLSPDRQKNMVRPAKESLGERPLQVGESSKVTDRKLGDGSADNQASKTSDSKGLSDGKEVEDNSQLSLIDFDSDSLPSNAAAAPKEGENQQPNHGVNNNSKESSTKQNAQPAPKPNTLEFLLQELSVPSVEPAATVSEELNIDNSPTTSGGDMLTSDGLLMLTFHDNIGASTNAPVGNVPMGVVSPAAPSVQTPAAIPSSSDVSAIASGNGISGATPAEQTLSLLDALDSTTPPVTSMPLQPSNVPSLQQHQLTAFPPADGRPSGQRTSSTTAGGPNNQPWTSMHAPNAPGPCTSTEHSSQDTPNTVQDSTSGNKSQHFSLETKSIGRKELPVDLFAASYSQTPGSIPAWQNPIPPPYGTGYNMQYYPNSVPARVYPNQSMSSNPFDINNETTSVQIPAFDVSAPGAIVPISQIHSNSSGFMASQPPSFASAMPQRSSSYGSMTAYGPGPYMGQQEHHMNAPPSRTQGSVGGFGTEDPFSSLNVVHQSSTAYQLPSARSLPSLGGNPFG